MHLYSINDQPEAALGQYEACRRILQRELGVLPGAETRAQADQIRLKQCGTAAAAPTPVEARRHVTLMHCELAAPGMSDPEDIAAVLAEPRARCEEIIHIHAGHLVQGSSIGLLACFGFPVALENTALCAVRAAHQIVAESFAGVEIRIGIHSGEIMASNHAGHLNIVGTTSGIAARLQLLASAGEVITSGEVRQSVAGYFQSVPLGRHQALLQGYEAFRIEQETGASTRLAAAVRLSPFIGRSSEFMRLKRHWVEVRRGHFHSVLLHGDAGIGKSRLAGRLISFLNRGTGIVRELRCFPETSQSPFQAIIVLLTSIIGLAADDPVASKFEKLRHYLQTWGTDFTQRALPFLATMLGLKPADEHGTSGMTPAELKTACIGMLVELLQHLSAQQPVLLVAEDMHWADASTQEVFASLSNGDPTLRVLLLMTARPEWSPNWPGVETLELKPLEANQIGEIVRAVRPDIPLLYLKRIIARAEGIPLFAEELASTAEEIHMPASVQELLMARLDQMGSASRLAQLAACVGREFELELLGRISGFAHADLRAALKHLQRRGLVVAMADQRLQFKHALVQEAAYQSQTRALRRAVHLQVAALLETDFRHLVGERAELVARHWAEGGAAAKAIPCWLQAGRHAERRFAHTEAIAHYDEGLRLIPDLAAGAARDHLEFALLLGLAQSEQAVNGYGQKRSAELLARAVTLQEQGCGDGAELFQALWGLWEGASSRTDHADAVRLARRMIEIAVREHNHCLQLQGHYALGNSLLWTGALTESRHELETAIAMEANADSQAPLRDCYGSIVPLGSRLYLSWVLWLMGETEQAESLSNTAIALAQACEDAYGLAFALTFAATLQRWQGNADAASHLATEGLAASGACKSAVFSAAFSMTIGWANVMRGDSSALADIEQGIEAMQVAMCGVTVPLLAPYAEALLHLQMIEKSLKVIEDALLLAEVKHDRHFLAELHRLQGVCLVSQGQVQPARTAFEKAIEVSRLQGAATLECRATAALARLTAC